MRDFKKPISWEQGLFLQPQHFQITELYHAYQLSAQMKMQNPYFWGISACEYDQAFLAKNMFSLTSATVIMPDGTLIEIPENGYLAPRSFDALAQQKVRSFKVYLGIKVLQEGEPNVSPYQNSNQAEYNTRFVGDNNAKEYTDVYYAGPSAGVKQLRYVVRLFWEGETSQLQNYILLPIARIVFDLNNARLDETFSPPVLNIKAASNLLGMLETFAQQLLDKVQNIESLKHNANYYEQSSNQTKLLILQSLGRAVPILLHALDTQAIHPIRMYEILVGLLGELSIFTADVTIAGTDTRGNRLLPYYQHEDIYSCLKAICDFILATLEKIIQGSQYLTHTHKEGNLYVGEPAPEFFNNKHQFYLLVQAPSDQLNAVSEHVLSTAKLCAYGEMGKNLEYALPGIALKKNNAVPSGVARLSDCLYFQIDSHSAAWEQLEKQKKLAFYVGNLAIDLNVSIAAAKD